MAIDKPSLNDFLPNGFETQDKDGYKVNFDADKISAGYDKDTLEILSGPNLNNLLDNVGKNTHVLEQFLTFFRDMPIGSFPVVNTSNQLDYKSVNSFFRNVGEIVFSAIPLEDGNLRLLDGSLLEYTMTYSRFITYIAGYRTSLPNLFCTQAEFDQSVATYGVCGKFVYDTETKSLRLPKISGFIKGTLDSGSLGDVDEAKAPNITGSVGNTFSTYAGSTESGALYRTTGTGGASYSPGGSGTWIGHLDASRCSSVYKDGVTTIEPQAVKEFIYIVVSIDEAEKQVLSAVYNYKGSVPTYADLPQAVAIGEVYNVIGEDPEGYSGANFAWTGEEWDRLGGTVNLSGYLTKTEAGNTYATKASLESNVDYLQGQINTNASNIANIASQEVIDAGIQKIEMLKFASTLGAGKVADTDLYSVIKKYKYSSFDVNKFTKVGTSSTPNITKDGIASRFGNSNYLYAADLNFANYNTWEIGVKIKYSSYTSTQMIFNVFKNNLNNIYGNVQTSGKVKFAVWETPNGGSTGELFEYTSTYTLLDNAEYFIKFRFTGTKYEIGFSTDNLNYTWETAFTSSTKSGASGVLNIGIGNNTLPFTGSIDLKGVNIIVDGVPVFSGNKTGIDTIKHTDFRVITTMYAYVYSGNTIYADSDSAPTELYDEYGRLVTQSASGWQIDGTSVKYNGNTATQTTASNKTYIHNPPLPCSAGVKITEDGVASGFSGSKRIERDSVPALNKPFKIEFKIKTGMLITSKTFYSNGGDYYNCLKTTGNQTLSFMLQLNNDGTMENHFLSVGTLSRYTEYKGFVSWTGTEYRLHVDGFTDATHTSSLLMSTASNTKIKFGCLYTNEEPFNEGSIDLNAFKIYVDGNLVYQPCLKIPYHLSKTGLKITDKLDRAIDMSEQCGFSDYFGLDEDNALCLVPQGDNITGRRELISRVEDSTTHYVTEIYSDLYCKQMGSGTASTAVTLNIPYKDANYKLSVPQSAKSKTGFTPTASCDWIAEGYIYLDEVT